MITTIQWVETKDGEILAKKGEAYYRLSEISITDFLRENGIHPDQIKEKEEKPVEVKKNSKTKKQRNITIVRRGKEKQFPLLDEMTGEEASFYKTSEQFASDDLCNNWNFSNGSFHNCFGFRVSLSRCLTRISENYMFPIAIVRTNRGKNKIYAFHLDARREFMKLLSTDPPASLQKYWIPKKDGDQRTLREKLADPTWNFEKELKEQAKQ